MGQGQSEMASALLKSCREKGKWLCIQNLHLAISWIPLLEAELQSSTATAAQGFRLFITTEAHPKFSPVLLEKSFKITLEAPPGLKRNLLRVYESWTDQYVSGNGSVLRSQCLFAVAWFHAVMQELRSFIPQGWTKFYDFSVADLASAATLIDSLFSLSRDKSTISWITVHGILKMAIYGGKVESRFDTERLSLYLQTFFNDEVFTSSSAKKLARGIGK